MKAFAQLMHKELQLEGDGEGIEDICAGTDRYCMFKTGPVLSISVSTGKLQASQPLQAGAQAGTFRIQLSPYSALPSLVQGMQVKRFIHSVKGFQGRAELAGSPTTFTLNLLLNCLRQGQWS